MKVYGMIASTKEGIYEIYEMNYKTGKCYGYKCFPGSGESNPCRTFLINDISVYNMRKEIKG